MYKGGISRLEAPGVGKACYASYSRLKKRETFTAPGSCQVGSSVLLSAVPDGDRGRAPLTVTGHADKLCSQASQHRSQSTRTHLSQQSLIYQSINILFLTSVHTKVILDKQTNKQTKTQKCQYRIRFR